MMIKEKKKRAPFPFLSPSLLPMFMAFIFFLVPTRHVHAEYTDVELSGDSLSLWEGGLKAFEDGDTAFAIKQYESLADRNISAPELSFNRGLAYLKWSREKASKKTEKDAAVQASGADITEGSKGQALAAFHEAYLLSDDASFKEMAKRWAEQCKKEIVRSRQALNRSTVIEPIETVPQLFLHLLSENQWSFFALLSSFLLFISVYCSYRVHNAYRWLFPFFSLFFLILCVGSAFSAHHLAFLRRTSKLGVLVRSEAKVLTEAGLALPQSSTLPEGAIVRVEGDISSKLVHIYWGKEEGYLPYSSVRTLGPWTSPMD